MSVTVPERARTVAFRERYLFVTVTLFVTVSDFFSVTVTVSVILNLTVTVQCRDRVCSLP